MVFALPRPSLPRLLETLELEGQGSIRSHRQGSAAKGGATKGRVLLIVIIHGSVYAEKVWKD